MVMASRPDVATASLPIAAVDVVGLAQQLTNALVRVPFRDPLRGSSGPIQNFATAVTRETVRSFMGYSSSLPVPEFRSLELVLDELCRVVMRPVVARDGVAAETAEVGGVPGIWYRPRGAEPAGTIVYLHGGGYIGTSPTMYAFFTANLARRSGCEVFVADYRLAPEFPFPAGLCDAIDVVDALLATGTAPDRLFVAGDSGGGGLAGSLMLRAEGDHLPSLAGVILFSPEVDLTLDEPSITENASFDILPWNIPTAAYLDGTDPASGMVSTIDQDLTAWPPTFVAYGGHEMFRDPIRTLVERLGQAGVDTTAIEEGGMFHVFPILMPWSDASRRVLDGVAAFVAERLVRAGESTSR
jgi:acetyl esterase/lipase